jgi:hypothetical protein
MMTTVVTRGAASAQALGYASSSAAVNYIEDVFSTYLYTGNGSTQTITNGIDLSGKGGLVWTKNRIAAQQHTLADTARGIDNVIYSSLTNAQTNFPTSITAISSTGYSLGSYSGNNGSGDNYVSWTFREQPKFFDIVTYTGNGVAGRTISHNLGSVPGCIIVKQTSAAGQDWMVYHRSLAANGYLLLNSTGAVSTYPYLYGPTSTTFTVDSSSPVNANGATYVAYLFAHDAGGFGLTGTDNVISCGSFTRTFGTANSVNIGYEPQWVLIKCTSQTDSWQLYDTMRGLSQTASLKLEPNSTNPDSDTAGMKPTATGFDITATGIGGGTFIYIAVRRGPMRVPTDATKVFTPIARTGTGATATVTGVGSAPDLIVTGARSTTNYSATTSRLAGPGTAMFMPYTQAENTGAYADTVTSFNMNGVSLGSDGSQVCNGNLITYINWFFCRAPGYFDVVCYTGTGVARTVTHNLAAVPELMIVKRRNASNNWTVYSASMGNTNRIFINQTAASAADSTIWNNTTPTSSVFTVGTAFATNNSGDTYVAYLFATVAGVSKVGSYTGTGTTLQINCGFTAGSRFVLIKRTDSTGDWYVWDSARGIVAGNDPYLLLNSTAAEVTGTDYVDTYSAGFEISSTAPAAINANGGTFIFLAIA